MSGSGLTLSEQTWLSIRYVRVCCHSMARSFLFTGKELHCDIFRAIACGWVVDVCVVCVCVHVCVRVCVHTCVLPGRPQPGHADP